MKAHWNLIAIGLICWQCTAIADDTCGTSTVQSPETSLVKCLLGEDYDPIARPVKTVGQVVNVSLSMYIMKVVDVVEKEHTFHTKGWIMMKWTDEKLTWDPKDYGGVEMIWIDAHRIWKPDIMVYNYADDMYQVMLDTPVHVGYKGDVHWVPNHAMIKAYCNLDLTWFPYDTQACSLVFGSWSNDLSQVDLYAPQRNNASRVVYDGKEWTITDINWKRHQFQWGGVAEYPAIIYTIKLQRQPTYYRHLFVIPTVTLALLTAVLFLIPAQSGSRLGLGGCLLISNTLLMTMLENHLPTELGSLPAVMVYLTFQLVMLFISLIVSVLVMNMQDRGNRKAKVPRIVKSIFLGGLSRCLCVPAERYVSIPTEDTDGVTSASLNPSELRIEPDVGISSAVSSPSDSNLDKTLLDIRRYLSVLSARAVSPPIEASSSSHRESVHGEWLQFAAVLDRLLFIVYLVLVFLITAVLFGKKA